MFKLLEWNYLPYPTERDRMALYATFPYSGIIHSYPALSRGRCRNSLYSSTVARIARLAENIPG